MRDCRSRSSWIACARSASVSGGATCWAVPLALAAAGIAGAAGAGMLSGAREAIAGEPARTADTAIRLLLIITPPPFSITSNDYEHVALDRRSGEFPSYGR